MRSHPSHFLVAGVVGLTALSLPINSLTAQTVLDLNSPTRVANPSAPGGYDYPIWKPMAGPTSGPSVNLTNAQGYLFDPVQDQQTGQPQSDFASTATELGFFRAFGTINGIQHIGFRILLNEFKTNGTLSDIHIGMDGGALDGKPDIYIYLSQTNNKVGLTFRTANITTQNTNTSPSTTAFNNFFYPTAKLSTSVLNGGADVILIDGSNGTNYTNIELTPSNITTYYPGWTTKLYSGNAVNDGMISFAVPVADLNAAITQGLPVADRFTVSSTSLHRFVAVTSTQANSINQDAYGTVDNTQTYASFLPIESTVPIPEPSSIGMILAMSLGFYRVSRRRNVRSVI